MPRTPKTHAWVFEMAFYGNRLLGVFFLPVVALHADGFTFQGKRYPWSEVRKIRVWERLALILLRDEKAIVIRAGAFEKKGAPLRSGYSSAFNEVIGLFKGNVKRAGRVGLMRRDSKPDAVPHAEEKA
jgi:hypothetical protein